VADFQNTNWWGYLDEPMRDLVRESYQLLEREEANSDQWHDYSFIVFPMAKAYEGFLKKLFFDLGLISNKQYQGDRFRVGKSLNPHLPKRYQWDWVYGELITKCGGEETPQQLWDTWKQARNRIFHFFPSHQEFISLNQAKDLLTTISQAMDSALGHCKVWQGVAYLILPVMEADQNLPESGKSDQSIGEISFIKTAWGSVRNAIIGCSAAVLVGIVVLILSILSVTRPQHVFPYEMASKSAEVSPTPQATKTDYYLPYPGVLPDNPLYKVKAIRDKVRLWLTFDEGKKAQRELLYADKRINAALALAEGGKTETAIDTATKAEKYLEQAVQRTLKLAKNGQDVNSLLLTLQKATAKHAEILEQQLMLKTNNNEAVANSLKKVKSLQEQVAQTLLEWWFLI